MNLLDSLVRLFQLDTPAQQDAEWLEREEQIGLREVRERLERVKEQLWLIDRRRGERGPRL